MAKKAFSGLYVLLTGLWDLTVLKIRVSENDVVCENAVTGVHRKLQALLQGYRLLCGIFQREIKLICDFLFFSKHRAGHREYGRDLE